jgi:hypothetical protein
MLFIWGCKEKVEVLLLEIDLAKIFDLWFLWSLSVVGWVFFKDVAWTCECWVSDLLRCWGMFYFKFARMWLLTLWPVWTWVLILQSENEVSNFFFFCYEVWISPVWKLFLPKIVLLCYAHCTVLVIGHESLFSQFLELQVVLLITASQTNISLLRVVEIEFCSKYLSLTWPLDPCSTVMICCFWFAEVEVADRFTTSRLWFLLWRKEIKYVLGMWVVEDGTCQNFTK